MKKWTACLLPALALLLLSSLSGRADEFSAIANCPNTYWVPAPTPPPPGYYAGPPAYYYGPYPYGYYAGPAPYYYGPCYYGPARSRVYVHTPGFYIGFHIH